MAALVRGFIYVFIKPYHQYNVGFCVSECISTQGNVLYAKGKEGKHRHSKAASTYRDNKEVFALALSNKVCTSVQFTLPAFHYTQH